MPIYEYHCDACGTSVEIFQKMSDEPLRTCDCGGELRKVLHPIAIHFKGSGFYSTDYGKGSGRSSQQSGAASSSASAGSSKPSSEPSSSTASEGGSSSSTTTSTAPPAEKSSAATKGS